jgi:hypothetical protein
MAEIICIPNPELQAFFTSELTPRSGEIFADFNHRVRSLAGVRDRTRSDAQDVSKRKKSS